MKVLIIICSHECNPLWRENIAILKLYTQNVGAVDFAAVSSQADFHHYEDLLTFRFKTVNPQNQLVKLCDLITSRSQDLDYDWYVKIRPDIRLISPIDFAALDPSAVNARARVYCGPKQIRHGMSVNGQGQWRHIGDCHYDPVEREVVLDDQILVFSHALVTQGAFEPVEHSKHCNEWIQTSIFNARCIPLNVVGINAELCKYNAFSGDLNYPHEPAPANGRHLSVLCFK
jgi:hypothetical protein